MKFFHTFRSTFRRFNSFVKRGLRKVGIFKRLNISFLLLLLTATVFLTAFFFHQYSSELALSLDRYSSLLVQNVNLKIRDVMKQYEDIARSFYDDALVMNAVTQNASLSVSGSPARQTRFDANTYLIESKLYSMRRDKKHIVNVQFVSPTHQYHMVEQHGFQRGGTIRDLDSFYESDFYLLPQQKNGYPVWIDGEVQSSTFYKNEQNFYGLANIITLSVAVYEPTDRNFLGVLLMNIDLNTFSAAVEDYEEYNDGNMFLVGRDGVLSWFSPSLAAPSFPQNDSLYEQMCVTGQDVVRTRSDDRSILLSYEKVPGTEIFSCYVADLDRLMIRAYRIRNLSILFLAGIVIGCFVLSWYVTNSISDPIRRLITVMQKTGSGKWTARYENSGHDEITILGDCFNEMAENTNRLLDQVYLSEIRRQQALLSWKNAQLDALLMQINPHFLYNTLDIIRWEAMYEANGESRVTQMIEKFSQLCRMGMRTGGNTIQLSDGIEHASTYMEVINFRHRDKIRLVLETQVDADSVYIPQFILQPILENAVVHAFGDASSGYVIRIQSLLEAQTLHITVSDNGRGMTEEELSALRHSLVHSAEETEDKSIGLVNVHRRIRLFYGQSYGITVESTSGEGTLIKILLPLRDHSESMIASNETKFQEL